MTKPTRNSNVLERGFPILATASVCLALGAVSYFRMPAPSSVPRLPKTVYSSPIGPELPSQDMWDPQFTGGPEPKLAVAAPEKKKRKARKVAVAQRRTLVTPKHFTVLHTEPPALPKQVVAVPVPARLNAPDASEEDFASTHSDDRSTASFGVPLVKETEAPAELLALAPQVEEDVPAEPGTLLANAVETETEARVDAELEDTTTTSDILDVPNAEAVAIDSAIAAPSEEAAATPGEGFDEYSYDAAPADDLLVAPVLPNVAEWTANDFQTIRDSSAKDARTLDALAPIEEFVPAAAVVAAVEAPVAPVAAVDSIVAMPAVIAEPEVAAATTVTEPVLVDTKSTPEPSEALLQAHAQEMGSKAEDVAALSESLAEPVAESLAEPLVEAAADLAPELVIPSVIAKVAAPTRVASRVVSQAPVARSVNSQPTVPSDGAGSKPVFDARAEFANRKESAPAAQGQHNAGPAEEVAAVENDLEASEPSTSAITLDAKTDLAETAGPAEAPATVAMRSAATVQKHRAEGPLPVSGRLTFGKRAAAWLQHTGGHVEMFYQPVKQNADPEPVEYRFPQDEFAFELPETGEAHRVIARFFMPEESKKFAEVVYPRPISGANYRSHVSFDVTDKLFDDSQRENAGSTGGVPLSISIYIAGTSNYAQVGKDGEESFREPSKIPDAAVRIVGMPNIPYERANDEGIVRFQNVPMHSEVLLEIRAHKFWPTFVVVPIDEAPAFQRVYLVPTDLVSMITSFVTKDPQNPRRSVLMGRVFNGAKIPKPKEDVTVTLEGQEMPTVYFDPLPGTGKNKRTGKNGLFGIYNVPAGFKSVERADENSLPFLATFFPGAATYVELGRTRAKPLRGRFVNPFAPNRAVLGSVRLVGSPDLYPLDSQGGFELPPLDFPADVVTLELQADEFPLTWVSVPFSTRQQAKERVFYVIPEANVEAPMRRETRTKLRPDLGVAVLGADAQLFTNPGCYSVELEDMERRVFGGVYGPFPMVGTKKSKGPVCLTASSRGAFFVDLPAGAYQARYKDADGNVVRTRIVRVGRGRVSTTVN